MVKYKTEADLAMLRISGTILGNLLKFLASCVRDGISLHELDMKAQMFLKDEGAESAFLGYRPEGSRKKYPAAICTSLNDVVVHGIPSERILKNGDVLSIDAGVKYKGYITDAAITVGVGNVSQEAEKLMRITEQALQEAIATCRPHAHIGDIGHVIESVVRKSGFKSIQGLTGHGVGFALHEDPVVYNYGKNGEGLELLPGLVIAIEPMVAISTDTVMQEKNDSFVTKDGSISAHFEHTIAITKNGCEVLTCSVT